MALGCRKIVASSIVGLCLCVLSGVTSNAASHNGWLIVPGQSVGPIKLGMTRSEVKAVLPKKKMLLYHLKHGLTLEHWTGHNEDNIYDIIYRHGKVIQIYDADHYDYLPHDLSTRSTYQELVKLYPLHTIREYAFGVSPSGFSEDNGEDDYGSSMNFYDSTKLGIAFANYAIDYDSYDSPPYYVIVHPLGKGVIAANRDRIVEGWEKTVIMKALSN